MASIDNVNDITPRVQYVASASQTEFDYPFPIFADADLVVDVDGVTKALATHYTVAGEGDDAGGTVTFLTGLSGGEIVTIYRDIGIARTTDFQQNGPYSSESFNDELDRITLVQQELEMKLGRALRIPVAADVDSSDIELTVANFANKYLTFDADGKPTPAVLADATMTQATIGVLYRPRSAAEIAASVTPTNYYYDWGDVRRYGAVGDNSTDDTTALINAGKSSKRVYIDPPLTCRVTGTLATGLQSGQTWYGGGAITTANGFDFSVFDASGITDLTIRDLVGSSGTLGVAYSSADARFVQFTASSHRGRVLNCKVTGFQQAVRVHTSTDCKIDNNDIIAPYGWGVSIQTDADYAKVTNNRVSGCVNEHGIYVSGSSGNNIVAPIVTGNHVTGCATDGVKLTYCDDADVGGNYSASNTGQGIYATVGTNRANIHDNTSRNNGENGILVYDATTTSDSNRVHNNVCFENDKNGINVSSSGAGAVTRCKVWDNTCEDNDVEASGTQYGIVVSGANSTGVQIKRNTLRDEIVGLVVATGVVSAVLEDNVYDGCATDFSDSGTTTVHSRALTASSFTGTLTGCTTSPTGSIEYSVKGDQVTLEIPAISATSNTTTCTVTGMTAAIRPAAAQTVVGITTDNGTTAFGKIIVETSGVLTLHVAQSATFTGSGTKGVAACSATYRLT